MEYTLTIHKNGKQIALKVPEGYLEKAVVVMDAIWRHNSGFGAEFNASVGLVPGAPSYTLLVRTGDGPPTSTIRREKDRKSVV